MRSRVLSWFSRRFMRAGIAAALALLLVGGVALKSGEFFHPKPAYADIQSLWSSLPKEARVNIKMCAINAIAMGAVAGVTGYGIVAVIPRISNLTKTVGIIALMTVRLTRIAESIAITQSISWSEAAAKVAPTIFGTIGPACVGAPFGFWLKGYLEDHTADAESIDDYERNAQALAADPNQICSGVANSTLDDSGLCSTPDGYTTPNGTVIGPTLCGATPGTSYDGTSGLCRDTGAGYYAPNGDNYGSCPVGYPSSIQGTCFDPGSNQSYDQNGNPLSPQPSPLPEACTRYVVDGSSSLDDCAGAYTPAPTPVPDTPTATPNPYRGTWHGAFNITQYYMANFILNVGDSGTNGTLTLVDPETYGPPNWSTYAYNVIGTWQVQLAFSDTGVTGTFDAANQIYCGTSWNFLPKSFTLNLVSPNTYGGGSVVDDNYNISGDGLTCTYSQTVTVPNWLSIYR